MVVVNVPYTDSDFPELQILDEADSVSMGLLVVPCTRDPGDLKSLKDWVAQAMRKNSEKPHLAFHDVDKH